MKSVCPGARERSEAIKAYEGKSVEFLCDLSGRLLLLTGEFVVNGQCLEIHHTGRLCPGDLPLSDYAFGLSDPHLRSLIPTRDPLARTDYFMEKPLRLRDCNTVSMLSDRAIDTPTCR